MLVYTFYLSIRIFFFKKNFHDFLLSILEVENDYVEVPILLQKMANSVSSTQYTISLANN